MRRVGGRGRGKLSPEETVSWNWETIVREAKAQILSPWSVNSGQATDFEENPEQKINGIRRTRKRKT